MTNTTSTTTTTTATTSAIPCGVCGVGVIEPTQTTERKVPAPNSAFELTRPVDHPVAPVRFVHTGTFATCAECSARHKVAEEIVHRHPVLINQLGNVAVKAVAGALDALAAAGHPDAYQQHVDTPGSVIQLIRRFEPVRQAVRFDSRDADADAVTASTTQTPTPRGSATAWEHLKTGEEADTRTTLRKAYAGLLDRAVARSRPAARIAPPDGGGCLFCGIGAVEMAAVTVSDLGGVAEVRSKVWRSVSAPPLLIGGRVTAPKIKGHTCPECSKALDSAGAMGHGAMQRSFVKAMQKAGRADDLPALVASGYQDLEGLVAWAVSGNRKPNRKPWAHLRLDGAK
ncbi:hypothetical protein [Enemella sp. A6]|uniref:hypothetical protein n=1 Tax=Enemella sp. A6 TaxID=3440152 RepID=UPI003EBA5A2E